MESAIFCCLNALIDSVRRNSINPPAMGYRRYIDEYLTISVQGPRQSGHSTAIIDTIDCRELDNVAVLCHNVNAAKRFQEDAYKKYPHFKKKNIDFRSWSIPPHYWRGLKGGNNNAPAYVFIDCAYALPKNKKDHVLNNLADLWTGNGKYHFIAYIQ